MTTTTTVIEPIGYVVDRMERDDKILKDSIRNIHENNMVDLDRSAKDVSHNEFVKLVHSQKGRLLSIKKAQRKLSMLCRDREIQIDDAIEKIEKKANIFDTEE